MDKLFVGLPLKAILAGNLLAAGTGFAFLMGAPAPEHKRGLRFWFSSFWLMLTTYYLLRAVVEIWLKGLSAPRLANFLNLGSPSWFSLAPDAGSLWLLLVIISDTSTICLVLAGLLHLKDGLERKWVIAGVLVTFVLAWLAAGMIHANVISQILAVVAFLLLAWFSRVQSISASVVFLLYSWLHLPLGLATHSSSLTETTFLLLLGTKLPLIAAMYKVLGERHGGEPPF